MGELIYKTPIRLDTLSDVKEFVKMAEGIPTGSTLLITDGNGLCVNGKSMIGCLYSFSEFDKLFVLSDFDLGSRLDKFMK